MTQFVDEDSYPRETPLMVTVNSAEEEADLIASLQIAIEIGGLIRKATEGTPGRYWLRVIVPAGSGDPDLRFQLLPDDWKTP